MYSNYFWATPPSKIVCHPQWSWKKLHFNHFQEVFDGGASQRLFQATQKLIFEHVLQVRITLKVGTTYSVRMVCLKNYPKPLRDCYFNKFYKLRSFWRRVAQCLRGWHLSKITLNHSEAVLRSCWEVIIMLKEGSAKSERVALLSHP